MLALLLQLSDEMRAIMTEIDGVRNLIEKAQHGDRAAFDKLVSSATEALLPRIRRRVGSQLQAQLDAEDVIQETALRAFRSLPTFRWQGEKSFESWLYGIALNIILHSARERGKWKLLRITREAQATGPTPSKAQRREERFDRLEDALNVLAPPYRQVVQLARIEGHSVAEIAKRMKRTPGSVRSLLFRAMNQLRESFDDTESLGLPNRSIDEGQENGTD